MGSAFFHFEKVLKFSIVKNNPNVFLITKRFELFQNGWSWIRKARNSDCSPKAQSRHQRMTESEANQDSEKQP